MAELLLYGIIGDPTDKLDAATVTSAVRASTGPLSVRINSPGGFVMEGLAIVAALRAYPGKVTVYIDGLAASMASVIAMCGAEIIMAESSLLMIHNPWDQVIGDAPALRTAADQLDRIRDQMVGIYGKQTGLPVGDLVGMLDAETWFDAEQALAAGFVTSIAAPLKLAAMARATGLGFRHLPDRLKDHDMTDTTTTAAQAVETERTRISTIMALCEKHRLPQAMAQGLVARGTPLEQARAAILDHLAAEGDRAGIGHTVRGNHNQTSLDNPDNYVEAVRGALVAKISGKAATGPAAEFQGMSVVDIGRDYLQRNGARDVLRMAPDRVVSAIMQPHAQGAGWGYAAAFSGGHTTSDFPDLIGGASEKYLIERYNLQISPLKQLARESSRANFLTHYGVQVDGGIGVLDTVNEAGEFKNRTISTRKEGYALQTYGNIFSVSRQMLINDSLGALAGILNTMASEAANTEATVLAAVINSYIMNDGKPFFDPAHGNVAATGGAIAIPTLDAGRMAMRSQKTASGGLIDARPKFLLVPVAQETAAETLVASTISPTNTTEVNPFVGKLTPLAEPRLVGTAWYLFADPNISPALEYSYLNGQSAPFTDSQDGWRIDGTEYKVRHDFGAGVLDARMAYKNPGA